MSENKIEAVLALGGAFNPIHTQHVEILKLSKDYIESNTKYRIIEAYLAPATDNYVMYKMKEGLSFKAKNRINMCNLATRGIDWIKPINKTYGSAGECAFSLKPNRKCKVIVVLGADRAISKNGCPKWRRNKSTNIITIIVGRKGHTENLRTLFERDMADNRISNEFYILDIETPDVSSTMIREKIAFLSEDNQSSLNTAFKILVEENLINQNVFDYMIKNKDNLYF